MSGWLSSGRLVDVILVIVALEVIALLWWRHHTGRGLAPLDVFGQLLAGALLLAALRCAVTGAGTHWTLLFLTLSGPAHVFDLWRRVRIRRR